MSAERSGATSTAPKSQGSAARGYPRAVTWIGGVDGFLRLLDQTALPEKVVYRDCRDPREVWDAIRTLCVRGAPAIGIAAAYGVVLVTAQRRHAEPQRCIDEVCDYLATARPTAVNLFYALDRMRRLGRRCLGESRPFEKLREALLAEADAIFKEDLAMCRAIGETGAALIRDGFGILTHCNAGALATSDYGTALSCLFVAAEQGRRFHVFVDETRPLLQGARLTTWELQQRGIPCTLICDSAAATIMRSGRVQMVVTGADRIAANGDTANKIGTYGLAVLAEAHGIPFYVAAPSSTFDFDITSGDAIPIEQRDPEEVTRGFGRVIAPAGIRVENPAFDVTPAKRIRGIITEVGLIEPVDRETITKRLRGHPSGPETAEGQGTSP